MTVGTGIFASVLVIALTALYILSDITDEQLMWAGAMGVAVILLLSD